MNTLNIEYAVFCMEPVRFPVVFAHIQSMRPLKAAPFGAASFYIYKPQALAGVYV